MPRLSLNDVLAATATSYDALQSLRRRNQIGLAFGRGVAAASLSYVAADTVGMILAATLGRSHGQTMAAQIVRLRFDAWGHVVAEADARPERDAFLVVVDLERNTDRAAAHFVAGATDVTSPEALAADIVRNMPAARGFTATRVISVNISRLMRFIRAQGVRHGIDLSHAFLPPPDSDTFRDLMSPYVEMRDAAIIEVRNRAKREALAERLGDAARERFETFAEMQRETDRVH